MNGKCPYHEETATSIKENRQDITFLKVKVAKISVYTLLFGSFQVLGLAVIILKLFKVV